MLVDSIVDPAFAMSGECANPLLLGWIKEWLDQARERNTKGVTA